MTAEAVWAGGLDGGSWVHCQLSTKEPTVTYDCVIWNDEGQPWSTGRYTYLRATRSAWVAVTGDVFSKATISEYDFYNGTSIVVSDDSRLEPHGWVDYPFGDGHGKRVRYALGERLEEKEY